MRTLFLMPTPNQLRELLHYDPASGMLYWKPRGLEMFTSYAAYASWNKRWSGKMAFTSDDGSGYRQGRIFGKAYRAHRVAWAITYGAWPDNEIDHINGIRSDNRLVNLRMATRAENQRNTPLSKRNSSGFRGVDWHERTGKWRARITAGGPSIYLGLFGTAEEAHAAYLDAAKKLHREFSRVG